MTTPRRFAALAVCLLALAAGASAADCDAGSISMELVGASGVESHDLAKCLASATISISSTCAITIAAGATDNSFVPALWSSDSASYEQWKLCPAESPAAVTASTADSADVVNAIELALNGYIYGFDSNTAPTEALKSSGVTQVTFEAVGKVTVAVTGGSLVYAIRAKTGTTTNFDPNNADVSAGAGFIANTEYKAEDDAGDACEAGRYGMLVGSIKLCPLCPAGTYGDGNGCTACAAGKASAAVGIRTDEATPVTACPTTCGAGKYAQEGSSNCLPCPMHTYSEGGTGECTACPANTYAWLPGSTECVRCAAGVATAHTVDQEAGTAGSTVLSISSNMATCEVDELKATDAGYGIPAWQTCTTWKTGTITLQLVLEVAADCSVSIKPIGDASCADAGAVKDASKLYPYTSGTYDYTYNDLVIHAYYTSATTIRSLLPSTSGGASSFMVAIDQVTTNVQFKFYAATNLPAQYNVPATKSCTPAVAVAGGTIVGVDDSDGYCPAGTYGDGTTCTACPQGSYCAAQTSATATTPTDCTADNANPLLGQVDGTACDTCDHTTSKVTSLDGAAYCTVPYFNRMCNEAPYNVGGYEWDESAGACVPCRPGTYRDAGTLTTVLECQECPAGQYSGAGAEACTPCPAGQYSPTTGMADQEVNSNKVHCLRCPVGSIALTNGVSIPDEATAIDTSAAGDYRNGKGLLIGADHCEACPQGTYAGADTTTVPNTDDGTQGNQLAKACTLCASGTYRIGDASQNNNVCKKVPAGYKVTKLLLSVDDEAGTPLEDETVRKGAYEIAACSAGSVSYWTGETRTPADATACYNCEDDNDAVNKDKSNTYAPRTGMAQCLACKGGYAPNAAHTTCEQCAVGFFRSFYTKSETCAACPAGSEVGPSGRQACTLCRPGSYKDNASVEGAAGNTDNCLECPINKYQATPGATSDCIWCPKGTETQDSGNTECTPCAVGYYNPKTPTSGTTPACIKAPAGTFVNTTGAFIATQCPLGTYNADTAQDACEPCPPGQYANTLGNKVCKTCPAGTYSGGMASSCKACAAGYYARAGSGACSPCKPGTYASTARAGTCALCPKGKQCPTPATKTPMACPAGTYSSKDGSTLCAPCPVNTFSNVASSTRCQACAKGYNTRGLSGQKACQAVRVTTLRRSVL